MRITREYTFYHLTQEGEDEDNRQFSIDRAECYTLSKANDRQHLPSILESMVKYP